MKKEKPNEEWLYCFQCRTLLKKNREKVAHRLRGHRLGRYGHVKITEDHKHDFKIALRRKEIDMGPVNPREYSKEVRPSLPELPYYLRIPASDIAYLNEVYDHRRYVFLDPDLCTYRDHGADKWKTIGSVSVEVVSCPSFCKCRSLLSV
ncbi:hypothetical protein AKJ41_01130 [candidate division MSBL1 archaeon SCGC-AAA259O05]|uniref:Uncharacterized protein n=1 Tax=candidate division MSBL1 archaeon SCGC-AAA259O05 TaxID=1698271 RepID=A0A133V557_9EURY|nr:hypothetical protein AKJ41_01130 [candidate division MSBL1 archaeon SCGC-AAA259O05]